MSYKSLMRRSTRRHQVEFLSDSDSETEDRGSKCTPLSAPALQTELAKSLSGTPPRPAPLSNPPLQAASAGTPVLTSMPTKTSNRTQQDLVFQEDAVAGTLRPLWAETLLPIYSVDARTLQRVETLEQSFLHHQQQVQTQLDSMQEQLTALSQKQLDTASFPEQVVHHIEQDLAEVISRLDRQVDALMGRVDRLPSPEDWTIMEEALAAILDEAAARAQQQEKLKELDAAQEQTKEEDDDELFGSLSRADSFEQQSADGNSMAVVVKEESEDQLADALLDQEQLEQMLQQQQAEVQSRLDLMNEKMENWVVQCFSDLRTRIIDLEATSLVAKAEVLQASIGVSCNEVDIQATTQDHNEVDVQATTQDHNEDASEDAHPENSSAVQDGAGIDGGVDAIDAEEVPCRHSVQAMPLSIDLLTSSVNGSLVWLKQRLSQLPLSQVQWSGVAMALVAAMVWFGAIELWTRNTETLQMAH
ncbi:TPA: hypothetical protein ACH3X3_004562 [Trebouxia sp. C0006]